MMFFNLHSMRIINKCITSYSCGSMISFAETAIYNNKFSTSPYRVLPLFCPDRSMSINNVCILIIKIKLP